MDSALETTAPLTEEELAGIDAYWRAANYLTVGQIYLLDNPLLREPLRPEHIKPRLLGHWGTSPGLNLLYAHLNRAIVRRRPEHDLRYRAGPWRPRPRREYLSGGHLQRAVPVGESRRGRHAAPVPAVLVPRRHPEPRRAGGSGVHPRGRRAGLLAHARVRGGVRQPGPGGRLRRGRRRGRDRPARGELAVERVPQPRPRRRGAADPPPQRLQDRQPDDHGADPRGRPRRAHARARLRAVRGRRRRAGRRTPAPRRRHRSCARRDRRDPTHGPQRRAGRATALADGHPAYAQGLDRTGQGGRRAGGGHVPGAPGADRRRPEQPRPSRRARSVAAVVPARGTVRRRGRPGRRAHRAAAVRRAEDERQPARQRRRAAARPGAARFP